MRPNATSPRFLWVTPKYPLGAMDGARHATGVLVRNLVRLGAAIDLICLLPEEEQADPEDARTQLGVESCTLIRRSGSRFWPLPQWKIPFTFRTFAALRPRKALFQRLTRLLRTSRAPQDTVTVFDGLHAFAALDARELQALAKISRVVYRAHNVETVLWEQCEKNARAPWMRWLYRHQAALVKNFERTIAQTAAFVATVSAEDAARFKILAPTSRASNIPIGIDFPSTHTIPPVALNASIMNILFIGRLDWLPNKNGLFWFLKQVWPAVVRHHPDRTLKIAGVGNGDWLKPFAALPGVHLLGKVDRVEPLYRASALTLAPIFQGSGTRVKILESARFARATLSTALGAQGSGLIPGFSYFQAENQADWIRLLSALTLEDCRAAGRRAFRQARDHFDGTAVARRFMELLETREMACQP